MQLKERKIPVNILQLEALLRNISPQCHARSGIEADVSRRKAGYWGETQLDYFLKLIPQEGYCILNDLRLPFEDSFFQIDCLILTRRYCIIIESKNIRGTLFFDSVFDQLIRTEGENEDAFEDPIAQSKNHIIKLKTLLSPYFPNLPFNYLVSIASPKTIIKSDTNKIDRVCHAYTIVHKLFNLEKNYKENILTETQVHEICQYLIKLHTPPVKRSLESYGFTKMDLRPGVFCPAFDRKMEYKRQRWHCVNCNTINSDVFVRKAMDYFLLVGPNITSFELRRLLGLPNEDAAHRIVKKLKLPYTGKTKGRVYHMPAWLEEIRYDPALYMQHIQINKETCQCDSLSIPKK